MFVPSRSAHDLEKIKIKIKISLDARQEKKETMWQGKKKKKETQALPTRHATQFTCYVCLGRVFVFFP